jgi:hypothetical protein
MRLSQILGAEYVVGRTRSRLAVSMVGSHPLADVLEQCRLSYDALDASGYHSDCVDPVFVRLMAHSLERNLEDAVDAAADLTRLVDEYGAHGHLLLIGNWWMHLAFGDSQLLEHPEVAPDWLDDEDLADVRKRWERVFKSRDGYGN